VKILHYVDENKLAWSKPWLQLINYLRSKGLQNHILCRPDGTLSKFIKEYGLDYSTYKPHVAALPYLSPGLASIIREIKPDLIHTRLSSAALIGGYWGKRLGIPVISTIDKYPKKKYYRNSDRLIPCSSAVAAHMNSIGFTESIMETIYNPVNIAEYSRNIVKRNEFRRQHDIDENVFVILGAGRFVDWKGFDSLIKACSLLDQQLQTGKKWCLWLVGDGPELVHYEKCAAEAKMTENTSFWGFQSDIRPFLWAADLFVQPSRKPEGFSLMLLEAMAASLPAIATGIGGTLDIIEDGNSGCLFEPDDFEKLATILHKLLSEENLQNYAARARSKAEEFSVEEIGEQTIRFYENVIGDKRNY